MNEIKHPLLNQNELNLALKEQGFEFEIVNEIDSTNSSIKKRLNSLNHKFVLAAEAQTKGRGRQNRSFVSHESKGIYCSVLWKMPFDAQQVRWFSLMSALALAQAILKVTGLRVDIKWPNDLYLRGKKIAGILIESELNPEQTEIALILGFGINVYKQDFEGELKDKVGTLEDFCDLSLDRNKLLIEILKEFDKTCEIPYTSESRLTYSRFNRLPQKKLRIQKNDYTFEAYLLGINEEGYMECIKENGEIMSLTVEEIHFV